MALSWPSLYDPNIEILSIQGREPIQPEAHYLYHPHDVFLFTLYWNLVFHIPILLGCAICAFLNITFPPSQADDIYPLSSPAHARPLVLKKTRSRSALAALILVLIFLFSVGTVALGSLIAGYVLVGLFRAGGYNMSTWVPFLWSTVQTLLVVLGLWPSDINII